MPTDPVHGEQEQEFQAWQRGDDAVFDRLVTRWERPLFAFAWRYLRHTADAQDVVADTFVRLFRQRARLRPDTNLSAWLFTTAANRCHNQARWRRRHPDSPTETEESTAEEVERLTQAVDDAPSAAAKLERDEALQSLRSAVDRLPHHLKTTVLLHYMEGRSYQEIGAITGCSIRGVETRLYRARQRLRKLLGSGFERAEPLPASNRYQSGKDRRPGVPAPADGVGRFNCLPDGN